MKSNRILSKKLKNLQFFQDRMSQEEPKDDYLDFDSGDETDKKRGSGNAGG